MAHAAPSPLSVRAMSLSLSTALWAGLLVAMLSVGPRVVSFVPTEPLPILGIPIVQPPTLPPDPVKSEPIRQTTGETAFPAPVPTVPSTAASSSLATVAPPEVVDGPEVIMRPVWVHRPSADELRRYYPERALRREKQGLVSLACLVLTDGSLACSVAEEAPAGWGFGEAAVRISQAYRMQPATRDGQPVEARYTLRVPFTLN